MKCMVRLLLLLFIFLYIFNLTGCSNSSDQLLQDALAAYSNMIAQEIPYDLILTIYYIDPFILTRAPLSPDDLMQAGMTEKIVVHSQALKDNLAVLASLEWSILTPVKKESYMDARIHYVFERGNGEKLLEVTTRSFHHGASVFFEWHCGGGKSCVL